MRNYILTDEQKAEIRAYLDGVEGAFEHEFLFGDMMVIAEGYIETSGYREDDYFNGTGAWVETNRIEEVNLSAVSEDGEEFKVTAA